MLEWFLILAVAAAISSLLGYATLAAGIVTLAKFTLITALVVGIALLTAAIVKIAKSRRQGHGLHAAG